MQHDDLAAFEAGLLDPAAFSHRDHLRVAFLLLRRHRFTTAAERMSTGLRRMLDRVGQPDAYHETVTVAFLALVAERLDGAPADFDAWLARHPELLDRGALLRVYTRERLASPATRLTFLLPG